MKRRLLFALLGMGMVAVFGAASSAVADEASTKDVFIALDNPSGVAFQPETGLMYVSDSGAGRVLMADLKARTRGVVVDGFKLDIYGKGPMYNIGPLGLVFLNKDTLVVGGGDQVDGKEVVRFFKVPEVGTTVKVDDATHTLGPIAPGMDSVMGEGNFYALAASSSAVYATSNGDDTKGWVVKIDLTDGEPGELKPFIATKVATNVDAPVGITLDKEGQIVVGQMGEISVPGDSLLTIYDTEGKLIAKAATGLNDIAGLAYSPKTGKLYAVDFSWIDTKQGGLFRLDVSMEGDTMSVKTEKICSLDKPSALAFNAEGQLFVTVFGTAMEGETHKPGKVVQVLGEL